MEKELNDLQIKLMNNLNEVETTIAIIKDLSIYIKLGETFDNDLHLTSSALQDLLQKISQTVDPEHLNGFLLLSQQIKMMASDLMNACKQNMYSA